MSNTCVEPGTKGENLQIQGDFISAPGACSTGGPIRRRRIGPESGKALEILDHAIDYFIDESLEMHCEAPGKRGQEEAIRLLMSANRAIYYSCPEQYGIVARIGQHWHHLCDRARRPLLIQRRRLL